MSATIAMCSAYTSAITAWLQKVYEPANSNAAATPAARVPASSEASSTMRAHATAASTADARFSA